MSIGDPKISQAVRRRAVAVFNTMTARIEAALGGSWLPGAGKQLLDEIGQFCCTNGPKLGQRRFLLRLHTNDQPGAPETILTPQFIADARRAAGDIPLIDVSLGLRVLEVAAFITGGGDIRNAVTDASSACAIFFFENDRLCSIWAGKQLIKELIPTTWLSAGSASNRNWEACDYNDAVHEHYRRMVKFGQYLNHWSDPNARILKRSDPPKHGTTESIFHSSLLWWLQEHLPPHSVKLGDAEKGVGDSPDIIIVDFGCFYVVEVKWLGSSGTKSYTWADIKSAIRQGHRYASRSPFPEATSVVFYDGRAEGIFKKFKDHIIEEGIAEFDEWEGERMPVNGICYSLYLYSGSASTNAKKK